jgi:hypothetical protein
LIKKQVENVQIPKLDKKINFSFIKIAPFIFIAIFIGELMMLVLDHYSQLS